MTARSPGSVVNADPLDQVAKLPGVEDSATAARAGVDALLRHRILRRRSAEVTAEASLRAARASAALEGHDVPLETLRARLGDTAPDGGDGNGGDGNGGDGNGAARTTGRVLVGPGADESVDPRERSLAVTLGAVRLYAELGTLAPAWERAPRQALARMHVLAGRGLLPDDALGRPRSDRTMSDAGPGGPPPSPLEMSARLDGLTSVLTAPTRAPAIVVAAITHGELLAIQPFGVLDGIIARAAARLVLISRGLDPKALTATDVGHLELTQPQLAPSRLSPPLLTPPELTGSELTGSEQARATAGLADVPGGSDGPATAGVAMDYSQALQAYIGGGASGVATWIGHCARALELAARESLAVCEALSRA